MENKTETGARWGYIGKFYYNLLEYIGIMEHKMETTRLYHNRVYVGVIW